MRVPRFRSVLDSIPAYEPTEGLYDPALLMRPLSANEPPHPPLPGVVEAIAATGIAAHRYPDPGCTELTREIARSHGVTPDRILVGAGSLSLLQALFQAVAEPDTEVVHAWRSFELYPVLAELSGLLSAPVPLRAATHDLRAMADRLTGRTGLVLVCNPNNPTGTAVTPEELRAFVDAVSSTCLVAVDEAYIEYADQPSAMPLCESYPNLVVLRTFSKAYGLASLRVGYLLGSPFVISQVRKVCLAYAVSAVAQQAALASLGLTAELQHRVQATMAERRRVRDTLLGDGWQIPEAQGNFVWLPLGADTTDFGVFCTSSGIAVRTYPDEGVRVSIGSPDDNDALLAAAAAWQSQRPSVHPHHEPPGVRPRLTGDAR